MTTHFDVSFRRNASHGLQSIMACFMFMPLLDNQTLTASDSKQTSQINKTTLKAGDVPFWVGPIQHRSSVTSGNLKLCLFYGTFCLAQRRAVRFIAVVLLWITNYYFFYFFECFFFCFWRLMHFHLFRSVYANYRPSLSVNWEFSRSDVCESSVPFPWSMAPKLRVVGFMVCFFFRSYIALRWSKNI